MPSEEKKEMTQCGNGHDHNLAHFLSIIAGNLFLNNPGIHWLVIQDIMLEAFSATFKELGIENQPVDEVLLEKIDAHLQAMIPALIATAQGRIAAIAPKHDNAGSTSRPYDV